MSKPTWAKFADVFQASKAPHWKGETLKGLLAREKAAFERKLLEAQLMRLSESNEPVRQTALDLALAHYRKMSADIENVVEGLEELPREPEYMSDG